MDHVTLQLPRWMKVGPYRYAVLQRKGPQTHPLADGEMNGFVQGYPPRRIVVRSDMLPDEVFWTFLHEVHHAWELEMPWPRGVEARCNHFATMTLSLLDDLIAQRRLIVSTQPLTRRRGVRHER